MTGTELQEMFLSYEFKQGLEELSSYLASIKQERPIVFLLAKCLWRHGYKFKLEDKKHDLSLHGKRIEFKFHYDADLEDLKHNLPKHGDNLKGMWELVEAGKIKKSWRVMPLIYEDVCVKKPKPDIFVWIICSRDLSGVAPDDPEGICWRPAQCKYNANHPYDSDRDFLTVADEFFAKLQVHRPFALLKLEIPTKGVFPSTYHFRICDFT